MSETYLTAEEAARTLRVSYQTILNRINDGSMPHIRFGKKMVRIPVSALASLVIHAKPTAAVEPELVTAIAR